MKRRVYRISKAGNIKRLALSEEEISAPLPNEVQIALECIGLNFADIFAILGLYSATPQGSFIPGLEYSGEIIAVGSDVKGKKVGDKVMGVTRFGAYSDHLNIDSDYVVPLPHNWSFEKGASYLVQGLTAFYGLFHLGNLKSTDTVLIHSAAGGVGLFANRMAKRVGAYTIGTIGSPIKIELLRKEGYDDWIVRDNNFKDSLKKTLGNRELNLVMECIGGKVFEAGFEFLAPQGRLINYGAAHYGNNSNIPNWPKLAWKYLRRPRVDPQSMIESNKSILGFNLIWLYNKKELMKQLIGEMNELNLPAPHIGNTFQFDDMYNALKLFQSGKTMGKVVVKVS